MEAIRRLFPPHGTRQRYRKMNCRCVACTRQGKGKVPEKLTWPFQHLERAIGLKQIKNWYSIEQIEKWRADGLGDFEADEVAIRFGTLPHFIWKGWLEAGLDSETYP